MFYCLFMHCHGRRLAIYSQIHNNSPNIMTSFYTPRIKKNPNHILAVISSNLNRFSKIPSLLVRVWNFQHTHIVVLPLGTLNVQMCGTITRYHVRRSWRIKHLMTYDWMVNSDTVPMFAQSFHILLTYILEDAQATHQLHCQWCSVPCHANHASSAALVRQCYTVASTEVFIILLPAKGLTNQQIIFNRMSVLSTT